MIHECKQWTMRDNVRACNVGLKWAKDAALDTPPHPLSSIQLSREQDVDKNWPYIYANQAILQIFHLSHRD